MMKRVFFVVAGVLFVLLLLLVLLVFRRSDDDEPVVRLKTYTALSGTVDSDGDGVPNWLEEITDSDSLNAESFPYNKDVVRAGRNTADALLYDGPGDFTEEIIQRFLFDLDGSASITKEEGNQFVDESVDYFLRLVEKRGLPNVVLYIDDTISRQEVLSYFAGALQQFSSGKKPIDVLVFDVFSKNASVTEGVRQAKASCDITLRNLPRKVPRDVYGPYYLVLERVIYLCEALDVALTANTAENFFYALRLVSAGRLFEDIDEGSADSADNGFLLATQEVVRLLEQ